MLQAARTLLAIVTFWGGCTPLGAEAAFAQSGWVVGVGLGASAVSEAGHRRTGAGLDLHARGGVGLGATLTLLLEIERHHPRDDEPRLDDVVPDGEVRRRPEVLRTDFVLLSLLIKPSRFYARPGLGLGVNRFAGYLVGPGNRVLEAGTSTEGSIALGLALGWELPVSGSLAPAGEVYVRWDNGEDTTSPRTVVGARAVLTLGG